MFYVDSDKCTGCGLCADVCPQGAISLRNNTAVIDQALCSQCGNCATICPAGAIKARAPVYAELGKGGDIMIGRGWFGWRGRGGGMGFGFRGASPPWPYVGIGRGGLPRCGYFLSGAGAPPPWPYQQPFYGREPAAPGYAPFAQMTKEKELDYLRNQAEAIQEQLEQIESRMRDLESEQKK